MVSLVLRTCPEGKRSTALPRNVPGLAIGWPELYLGSIFSSHFIYLGNMTMICIFSLLATLSVAQFLLQNYHNSAAEKWSAKPCLSRKGTAERTACTITVLSKCLSSICLSHPSICPFPCSNHCLLRPPFISPRSDESLRASADGGEGGR